MPRYHYHALNADGISLEGMLRADNERDVARQLERRGLSVVEVTFR
jgi:general secretion pathway protein F